MGYSLTFQAEIPALLPSVVTQIFYIHKNHCFKICAFYRNPFFTRRKKLSPFYIASVHIYVF